MKWEDIAGTAERMMAEIAKRTDREMLGETDEPTGYLVPPEHAEGLVRVLRGECGPMVRLPKRVIHNPFGFDLKTIPYPEPRLAGQVRPCRKRPCPDCGGPPKYHVCRECDFTGYVCQEHGSPWSQMQWSEICLAAEYREQETKMNEERNKKMGNWWDNEGDEDFRRDLAQRMKEKGDPTISEIQETGQQLLPDGWVEDIVGMIRESQERKRRREKVTKAMTTNKGLVLGLLDMLEIATGSIQEHYDALLTLQGLTGKQILGIEREHPDLTNVQVPENQDAD